MNFHKEIFQAAEQGQLYRLKVLLDHAPESFKDFLLTIFTSEYFFNGSPLLAACKHEHFDIVFYLLNEWNANVEQKGKVSIDGKEIQGVTALWCAASSGNLKLCKLLLKHRASVNGGIKNNSTPLHAACYKGHFEIVKYLIQEGSDVNSLNSDNRTCLMIACFNGDYDVVKHLLNSGADVNKQDLKGATALHHCIHSASLDVFKMLLEFGAKCYYDISGFSPLFYAALRAHSSFVEHMIQTLSFNKLEIINALELLGAAVVLHTLDTHKARQYWKIAIILRFRDEEFPILKPPPSLLEQCIGYLEPRNLNQLMLDHDNDLTELEAVLIMERILGPGVPINIFYIRYLGEMGMTAGLFLTSLQLLRYPFDVNYEVEFGFEFTMQLHFFMKVFSIMLRTPQDTVIPIFTFQTLLFVFIKALKAFENSVKQFKCFSYYEVLYILIMKVLHMIGFMCHLKSRPTSGYNDIQLKRAVFQFVNLKLTTKDGLTPLHLALVDIYETCNLYPILIFPFYAIIELLLEVGACPNAMDHKKNTPLHLVAKNYSPCTDLFILLLNYNAHLDVRNEEQLTPLQLAENFILPDICPMQHINLQCLCAKTIKDSKVTYVNVVPETIREFLDMH